MGKGNGKKGCQENLSSMQSLISCCLKALSTFSQELWMLGDVEIPGNVESFPQELFDLESEGWPIVHLYCKQRNNVIQENLSHHICYFLRCGKCFYISCKIIKS